jgi:hypothetical protein
MLARRDPTYTELVAAEYAQHTPRGYIGWAATMGFLARGYNEIGKHAEARAVCERALEHVTDADREYVSLFLPLDLQLSIAQAGLGEIDAALARIDGLLARFADCDHPLLHGLLHEARAQIAWESGDAEGYERSLEQAERWLRPTGTPALIAKCERLAQLASSDNSITMSAVHPLGAVTVRGDLDPADLTSKTEVAEPPLPPPAKLPS